MCHRTIPAPPPCSHECPQYAGVFWTKGNFTVTGGQFVGNGAADRGGVFHGSSGALITVAGGNFLGNHGAEEGGVGYGTTDSVVVISGGTFSRNSASSNGGAFYMEGGGDFMVRGHRVGGTGVHYCKAFSDVATGIGEEGGRRWRRIVDIGITQQGSIRVCGARKNCVFSIVPSRHIVQRVPLAHWSCSLLANVCSDSIANT